jgi:hypothetical protein
VLKAKPGLQYRGVWHEDQLAHYQKGDMVTLAGSGWIAVAPPTGRPGTRDSGWQMAVKSAAPPRQAPVCA